MRKICLSIFLIMAFSSLSLSEELKAWKIGDKYLTPECFVYPTYSGDQYETFFETYFQKEANYDSQEFNDFRINIGNYLNKDVPLEHSIEVNWGSIKKISITTYLDSCLSLNERTMTEGEFIGTYYYYEVIENVSVNLSSSLAPHIDSKFEEIKLVKYSYRPGSMGTQHRFIIYGTFKLKDDVNVILPLRNFYNLEKAKKTILDLN